MLARERFGLQLSAQVGHVGSAGALDLHDVAISCSRNVPQSEPSRVEALEQLKRGVPASERSARTVSSARTTLGAA